MYIRRVFESSKVEILEDYILSILDMGFENIINQIDIFPFKDFVSNKKPILEYLSNYINIK